MYAGKQLLLDDPKLMFRLPGPDRPLFSANDWYGRGALFAITGEGHTAEMRRHAYCGKRGAGEQFMLGKHHNDNRRR